MRNYKSILCLLLSLVLIFSVVFPMGAAAVEEPGAGGSGSKGVTVNFICGDKTFDPVMIYVDANKSEITPADLAGAIPEGYGLANDQTYVLKFDNPIYVELVDSKSIWVDYVDEGGNPVFSTNMTVPYAATTVDSADLVGIPTGYEVAVSGELTIVNGHVEVVVKQIPYDKYINVSYVLEDGTVVDVEKYYTKTNVSQFDPADLKNVPEGYKIVNMNKINILPGTVELKVLVTPVYKEIPVKFMYANEVIFQSAFYLAPGESKVLDQQILMTLCPEWYELADKVNSVTVKYEHAEVRIAVLPVEKDIEISYVLEDGTVVGKETVTTTSNVSQFDPADLKNVPEGYNIANMNKINILPSTVELKVLVTPVYKEIPVKFMYANEVIFQSAFYLAPGESKVLDQQILTILCPEGYELADKVNSVTVKYEHAEVRIAVLPVTKSVLVNYVTEDGDLVLTSEIVVGRDESHVNTSLLTDVPYGYEIANAGDMPIKGNHIDVVVREKEYTKSIVVNYVDEEGKLVLTSDILMDKEATHVNTSLLTDVPYGYEIANNGDMPIEGNAITVVVREKAYTKSVLVNYVNEEDNKCVLTSSIVVYMDAISVNTSLLTDVPTGYEIAVTGDMPIEGNHINVFVREKTYTKSVVVNYITEDGALVLTSDVVVLEEQTSVNTSVLTDVPYGYEIANAGDMPIEGNHIDVVVRQKAYTKSVLVNYVTEDGTCVLTSDIVMDKDATYVNTSQLTDVPYGYEIANAGDMPIKNGQIFVTVRSTYVPEPTVPEETKPEETKPEETKPEETKPEETKPEETKPEETKPEETKPEETKPEETKPEETKPEETKPAATEGKTPNTGDASHAMTWVLLLTVSAVCAVCAFFFLKKGNANR